LSVVPAASSKLEMQSVSVASASRDSIGSSSHPFLTFSCCQVGLQGFSYRDAPIQSGEIIWPSLLTFASPSECDSIRAGSLGPTFPSVMSASSHGIRAASAADISLLASPPPDSRVRLRSPTTKPTTRSALVVSHHLDGLLRKRAVGLLHPTTGQRFAAFLGSLVHSHTAETVPVHVYVLSPQRFSHPSKDSPRPQPHRVTTAVALLTFHSLPHCLQLRRASRQPAIGAPSSEEVRYLGISAEAVSAQTKPCLLHIDRGRCPGPVPITSEEMPLTNPPGL
jgi:hypothetical protein